MPFGILTSGSGCNIIYSRNSNKLGSVKKMKRIALCTNDHRLYRKISLILTDRAEVVQTGDVSPFGYSLVLVDRESFPGKTDGTSLPFTEKDGVIRNLPIPHELIIGLADDTKESERTLTLDSDSRTATVSGRTVGLTDVEFKLLSVIERGESFVSREELLREVWDGKKDMGVVNVYVHYLREKLEACGEKIIISSRGEGYKIDKRYKRGG